MSASPASGRHWPLILGICMAIAFLAGSWIPFSAIRSRLDALAGDGSAEPYSHAVHLRLQKVSLAIAVGLGVATALLHCLRDRQHLVVQGSLQRLVRESAEWKQALRDVFRECHRELVLLTIVAVLTRILWINQPMRFDEAYTWLQYARWPWYIAISRYDDPNNHLFHTLCVHVVTAVCGDSPWAIRLPAFTAGVLLIPVAMIWIRLSSNRAAAWMTGAFLACSSPLIEYSTNARGYTWLCLFTCLLMVIFQRLLTRGELLGWLLFSVLLALGCWTIPVMLYPLCVLIGWGGIISMHPAWSGKLRSSWKWEAMGALMTAGALTLILYTPVLITRGWSGLAGNSVVQRLSILDVLESLPSTYFETFHLLWRDQSIVGISILGLGLAMSVFLGEQPARGLRQSLFVALAVVCFVPLVQGVVPFPRVWLWVIPVTAGLAFQGWTAGCQSLKKSSPPWVPLILIAFTAVEPLFSTFSRQSILVSRETGAAPDAQAIAQKLKGWCRAGEPVVAIVPISAPLTYYAQRAGLAEVHLNPFYWKQREQPSAIVVVANDDRHTVSEALDVFQLSSQFDAASAEVLETYPRATVYRVKSPNDP